MSFVHTVQLIISWLLIIAVLLPFVKNDYWIFRILEYPRYQKFLICAIVFISLLVSQFYNSSSGIITTVLLGMCVAYLVYKISPYTTLHKKEMKGIVGHDKGNQLRLYTANVYQDNNQYTKILRQISNCQPDIIFLLETDKVWEREMSVLENNYPHFLKAPLPNKYGLLFYSRLEMIDGRVNYIVENDIPSIEVIIKLPSGQPVKLWGLHPRPPVPGEDNTSTAKDKELMKVALNVQKEKLPVVVLGDLNDVAWSHVTELFRKTTGLLDPRRGRGFYSTYSANHWFMRFPLDYVFCSSNFGLIQMKRLPHNGSDHFPIFIHFEFLPSLQNKHAEPVAEAEDKQEVIEKANQAV